MIQAIFNVVSFLFLLAFGFALIVAGCYACDFMGLYLTGVVSAGTGVLTIRVAVKEI